MNDSFFSKVISQEVKDVIDPQYPRWEKRLIKRKYGKYPAVYLDVWVPFAPRLSDMLPKYKVVK